MPQLTNAQARDVESLLHPVTNLAQHRVDGPLVIESGEGIYVYDNEGRRYVEGLAGLWCVGLGFGNEEMAETAREQISRLSYGHLFGGRSNENAIALAEKIKDLLPVPMAQVFFACSGSEANDTQVKLAWYKSNARGETARKKVLARKNGYHGVTVIAGSATGISAVPCGLRPAGPRRAPSHCAALLEGSGGRRDGGGLHPSPFGRIGGCDPARGAGDDLRLHRGAGDRRRRCHLSAKGVFRGGRGNPGAVRNRFHRRRGDLRFRTHGELVRCGDLRHAPDLFLHGQAVDKRLRAALSGCHRP